MTYMTHAYLAEEPQLRRRFVACAAQEGEQAPIDWVIRNSWHLIGTDMVAAWESYMASIVPAEQTEDAPPVRADPLGAPDIITDQMILSAVQVRRASLFEPPKGK